MLPQRVGRFIRRYRLIRPGETVICGISGGADSVCLLHVLHELSGSLNCRLVAAHLNHGLRREESDADAEFVARLAAELDIPLESVKRPVLKTCGDGLSLQERARAARLAFFAEVKERRGAAGIALGHTADDNVETVLMRLLLGGGPGALAGIRPLGPGGIIHPMLEETRSDILAYIGGRRLSFREDSSNRSEAYVRNRLRRQVIPAMRAVNPALARRIAAVGEVLADEDEYLNAEAAEAAARLISRLDNGISLPLEGLNRLPAALRRRVLVRALRDSGAARKELGVAHISALLRMSSLTRRSELSLPGNLKAVKSGQGILFGPASPARRSFGDMPLAIPGGAVIRELGIEIRATEAAAPRLDRLAGDPMIVFADADSFRGSLLVRARRIGDRFRPLGSPHTQSLKRFFINNKIDRDRRGSVPIICDEEKIIWIAGLRLDDRVKISPATKRAVRFELRPREAQE